MAQYIRLSTGRYVDLENMTKDDVCLDSIEVSLNNTTRYSGHTEGSKPLSVAQHTILVTLIAEAIYGDDLPLSMECILHDFAEAYYGDIASPVKGVLRDCRDKLENIDDTIFEALWPKKFGERTEELKAKRKFADTCALLIERDNLWGDNEVYPEGAWPDISIPLSQEKQDALFEEVANYNGYVPLKYIYESVSELEL